MDDLSGDMTRIEWLKNKILHHATRIKFEQEQLDHCRKLLIDEQRLQESNRVVL